MTGFVYSPVGSVLLLVGFAVIVSREWLVGFLYSSSDLLLLFGFSRLSRRASTCCFGLSSSHLLVTVVNDFFVAFGGEKGSFIHNAKHAKGT